MTKKEIQKLTTKNFMNTIDQVYGIQFSDDEMGGRIYFEIKETDNNGNPFRFEYARSYNDVCTNTLQGERAYDRASEIEKEMNEIAEKIKTEVENG